MSFKNPNDCLDEDFRTHAELLEKLTRIARQCLPANLAEHCWVSAYEEGIVVLVTDDAALATPIYYHQKKVLKRLNAEFKKPLKMHFKKASIRVSRFPIT